MLADIEWRAVNVTQQWHSNAQDQLTPELFAQFCRKRRFPINTKVSEVIGGLGYTNNMWVYPCYNIHGDLCYAKLWNNKWLVTAGGASANAKARAGEPVGKLWNLHWIVSQLDKNPTAGIGDLAGGGWLWLCEGEHDAVMLRVFDWLATSTTTGASKTGMAPGVLLREFGGPELATSLFSRLRGIIIAFDADDAGHQSAVWYVDALDQMLKQVDLPEHWQGVKAIDLRLCDGWGEREGFDISDLVIWGKTTPGVSGAGWLLDEAAGCEPGLAAAIEAFDVAFEPESHTNLAATIISADKFQTITLDELLDGALSYAVSQGSRGQGAFHLGVRASRNGWTFGELMDADVVGKLKARFDTHYVKDHEIKPADIESQIKNSFVDYRAQENLMNDVANVLRLHHYFPFLMIHPHTGWKWWSGMYWDDGEPKIWDHVMRLPNYIEEEAVQAKANGNDMLFKRLRKWSGTCRMSPRINAMESMAKKHSIFKPSRELGEEWDANPFVVGTPIGVFDLQTGQLLTGNSARNMFCSMTTRGRIVAGETAGVLRDADYLRCAAAWAQWLEQWQSDEATRLTLQEICGLGLRGTLDENIFVFQGSGRSGKSTLLDACRTAIGPYAYDIAGSAIAKGMKGGAADNNKTASIALMDSKRLITISEVGARTIDTEMIKTLTGETMVTGRALRQNPAPIRNCGTFIMMSNHQIDLRGDQSEALHGRLQVVEFLRSFVDHDRLSLDEYRSGVHEGSVFEKLVDVKFQAMGQRAGFERMPDVVITWMYEGLARVLERGYVKIAPSVEQATETIWSESDSITTYFAECGAWKPGGETVVAINGLWQRMSDWAKINDPGLAEELGSKPQMLSEMLKQRAGRGYRTLGKRTSAVWKAGKYQPNCWAVPWTLIIEDDGA